MSGTALILLLTILLSLLGFFVPRFISGTVLRPYRIARGSDYETLLTSGFVHADLGHLFFNLITFYAFGPPLEREIGTTRFLLLYLCGLLVSGLGTCIKHRDEPNYASLGASGAILAVLFASIVYFPHQQIFIFPLPLPIPAPLFAVAYLAFSYYSARRAASGGVVPATPPPAVPDAPAPSADPLAVPGPGTPAAPGPASPGPPGAMRPPGRINHDAHIFGALTGLVFVLITSPERFRALLHYFDGY
jgi:membrane associated rhomboid family serine protease